MRSHELARILLSLPDLSVATAANNHEYMSDPSADSEDVKIAHLKHYATDHIIIGNMSRTEINRPNWYIDRVYYGEIYKEWPRYCQESGHWIFPAEKLKGDVKLKVNK
jgi:hypothetical protein